MKIYIVWSQFTSKEKEIFDIYTDKKLAKKAVEEQGLVHRWMEERETAKH